jgi:hypothetical protein
MNDYLKNQLVRQDTFANKYKDGLNPESDYLKMEIEYLQEVNREKELQIQLYEKKFKKHERNNTQIICNNLELQKERTKNKSNKCLVESKNVCKATLRKQSESDATKRKMGKVKKIGSCPLCY